MHNSEEKKEIKEAFVCLCELFEKEITPVLGKIYFKVFANYSAREITGAISKAIHICKFFPKPAELIEFISGVNTGNKKIEEKAIIQANIIIGHLNNHGVSKIPQLDDPVSKWLMHNRWPYLSWASRILESELKWWIKEFKEAYSSISTNSGKEILKIEINPDIKKLIQNIGS